MCSFRCDHLCGQRRRNASSNIVVFDTELYERTTNGDDCTNYNLLQIGESAGDRDITVSVPIHEKDDRRTVRVDARVRNANGQVIISESDIFSDNVNGAEAGLYDVTLSNVPGFVTEVEVRVCSPDDTGDSFGIGAVVVGTTECSCQPPTIDIVSNDDVCAGQERTLTVSANGGVPGYTYQWSNGLGTNRRVEVSPTQNTTYSVTVTDDVGCRVVEDITIRPEPCIYDLALIKVLGNNQSATIGLGDQVTYNIIVANQGEVPSLAYEVEDRMPLGMSFVSASDGGSFDNNRTVNWTLPNLDPGQQKTITLVLQADDPSLADFRNWAEISEDSADAYGTTDEDSTPDDFTGNDSVEGLGGITTNEDAVNHNDISLDEPANDEDDNCLLYTSPSPRDRG